MGWADLTRTAQASENHCLTGGRNKRPMGAICRLTGRLLAFAGLFGTCTSSSEAVARCLPAALANDLVPFYQSTDPPLEVGLLTRETAADLQVCRIEGEWARIYLMPMFYWMRLSDLVLDAHTERIVRLDLPPNGEIPSREDWCHEAVTTPLKTPIFLRGHHDVIMEARIVPRWTPLLACVREGAWSDVQFEGRRGWVETRHLLVSTSQRERTRGFDGMVVCRAFFWKARTIRETPVFRWSALGDLEEGTLPAGREIEIAYARGPYLWVGHGGQWWYVEQAQVEVLSSIFDTGRVADRAEECGGEFRMAAAESDVPVFQSARSDEVILTVPAGRDFIVFEGSDAGRVPVRYLSVSGWVGPEGWSPRGDWTSLVDSRVPSGFQPSTLVSVVEAVERVPWRWRVGLLLGPAASGDLPSPGAIMDFVTAMSLGGVWSFGGGVSGLISDQVRAVGTSLGLSVRWDLPKETFLDLWLAASVQRIDADEVGLGLGARATVTLGLPLARPYEFGLAYTFFGHLVVTCTGGQPCPGSDGWFLHGIQAMFSVRL